MERQSRLAHWRALLLAVIVVIPSLAAMGVLLPTHNVSGSENDFWFGPGNVTAGSIAHNQATISWTTEAPTTGLIKWGYSPDSLTNTGYDYRDANKKDTTHYCIIKAQENTTTYYKIVSNGIEYGRQPGTNNSTTPGVPWNFTSFKWVDTRDSWPYVLEFALEYPDGSPATDVLGYMHMEKTGMQSSLALGISDNYGVIINQTTGERRKGSLRFNLGALRNTQGDLYDYKTGVHSIAFRVNGADRGTYPLTGWDDTLAFSFPGGDVLFMGTYVLNDIKPPRITHVPPGGALINDTVQIQADISDPYGVGAATLHYKYPSEGWQSKNLALQTGTSKDGVWAASINPMVAGEMQYYFTASDGARTSRSPRQTDQYHTLYVSKRPATQLVLSLPDDSTAGNPFLFTITAFDDQGNIAEYHGKVKFTADDPQAALPPEYQFTTEDGGTKTFQATLRMAGTINITATDSANGLAVTKSIIIFPGLLDNIQTTPDPAYMSAGQTLQFEARGYDPWNNPLAIDPAWTVWGGIGTIDQNGFFTATTLGTGYVNATYDGKIGQAQVFVSAGTPAKMEYVQGDGQTNTVAETCPLPLSVLITDEHGNPVSGVSVSWTVISRPSPSSGGSLSSGTSATNAQGISSVTFTMGTEVGDYVVRASRSGLVG
ncbi:MAG: hypothetical protein QCI38_06620, partial [Candidatus Thermoplasmatota archaeon]|nr:hypothetical protein [Candidatus Thermoplasmatota archaeon]